MTRPFPPCRIPLRNEQRARSEGGPLIATAGHLNAQKALRGADWGDRGKIKQVTFADAPLIFPGVGIEAPILYKESRKSKVYLNIHTEYRTFLIFFGNEKNV